MTDRPARGKRVRLFTRNGHDWTDRYPLIVEAAQKNRTSSFVIDGEAVLLGVDGISDFNGLHGRRHDGAGPDWPETCIKNPRSPHGRSSPTFGRRHLPGCGGRFFEPGHNFK
jgi:hypothetical protein